MADPLPVAPPLQIQVKTRLFEPRQRSVENFSWNFQAQSIITIILCVTLVVMGSAADRSQFLKKLKKPVQELLWQALIVAPGSENAQPVQFNDFFCCV